MTVGTVEPLLAGLPCSSPMRARVCRRTFPACRVRGVSGPGVRPARDCAGVSDEEPRFIRSYDRQRRSTTKLERLTASHRLSSPTDGLITMMSLARSAVTAAATTQTQTPTRAAAAAARRLVLGRRPSTLLRHSSSHAHAPHSYPSAASRSEQSSQRKGTPTATQFAQTLLASSSSSSSSASKSPPFGLPPPRQLVSHLDAHVVGQERPKKYLAVAVYNHYFRVLSNELAREQEQQQQADREAARRNLQLQREQERQHEEDIKAREWSAEADARWARRRAKWTDDSDMAASPTTHLDWHHVRSRDDQGARNRDRLTANEHSTEARQSSGASTTSSAYFSPSHPIPQTSRRVERWRDGEATRSDPSSSSSVLASTSTSSSPPPPTRDPLAAPPAPIVLRPLSGAAAPRRHAGGAGSHNHAHTTHHLSSPPSPTSSLQHAKSNVMLIGPSGSGKTLLMSTLASALSVPFVSIDATPLTSSGYVGDDVDVIGRRLLAEARRLAGPEASDEEIKRKAEHGIVFIDEVDKLARRVSSTASRDIGGEGVQQSLLRLLEGCVLHVQAQQQPQQQQQHQQHSGGTAATPATPAPQQPMATYQIDTSSVLFVTSGAFVGLDDIIRQRVGRGDDNDGDSSAASAAAAAAPLETDLITYGLIPEFVGRIPAIASLHPLTEPDLVRVMTEPRHSLVAQYTSLLAASNVTLKVTSAALRSIAKQALSTSTGARALRRIFEDRLLDVMYAAPGGSIRFALVDEDAVSGKGDVKVWSRGGKQAFMNAYDDEERYWALTRGGGDGKGAATTTTTSTSSRSTNNSSKSPSSSSSPRRPPRSPYIDPTSQRLIEEAEAHDGGKPRSTTAATATTKRKVTATAASPPTPARRSASKVTGLSDAQLATIARRKSRARLNRPSRVGNLRVWVDV